MRKSDRVQEDGSLVIGYTTGVFDLFHIGHLNLLRNARSLCDRLIVGVTTDELVSYKHKSSVIPFNERIEIVRSCRYVDVAVAQSSLDKVEAHNSLKFDILFVGDDWLGDERWIEWTALLELRRAKVIFLPYTQTTSSSLINDVLLSIRSGTSID